MTLMLLACWVGSPVTGYKSVRAVRRRGPAASAVLSFNSLADLWHGVCLQMWGRATSQRPAMASLLPSASYSDTWINLLSLFYQSLRMSKEIIYTVLPQHRIKAHPKWEGFGGLLQSGQIPVSEIWLCCYAAVAPLPCPAEVAPWQLLQVCLLARLG